jgi:hypothetical protein
MKVNMRIHERRGRKGPMRIFCIIQREVQFISKISRQGQRKIAL